MWVIQPRRHRLVHGYQPAFAHVGEQDPDHAEREVEVSGEVSHRGREVAQA
jgi:inosine/xanthosine triphosphate pyrophosphatase family protein